ncbi:hypothetical protein B9Z51_12590 [Limnohabitans sp. T6-5]|uniref:PglL family O-oligosaccharyltransferase n=1 Tax=Limnohabitans sp. T6-5 TaxID=1100724 RepID=UPI000D3A837C|nr:Wzy polymerase domain-containing protein [Limnohabitans sp. T6-5]PUE06771.1 hypothetical protein B9Z51_12590 [Limnohabitans sp. T6-5]
MRLNLNSPATSGLQSIWIVVLLALPWLQPWAPAPQANTVPLLISWACMTLLLVFAPGLRTHDVARAWVVAALISSAMGLVQYFGFAGAFSPWVHVPAGLAEANANLRQRNQLATLLAMGVLAVLWWQANGLKTRHALWMLALVAIGNAATASRTGLLHMVLVLLLAVYWSKRHANREKMAWPLALWAWLIYVIASALLPWALSMATGQAGESAWARLSQDEACGSRRVLWSNVLQLIEQRPWLGWGWGELKYAHYMADYPGGRANRFCDILGNAHNLPLHLAVTLGIPVAVLIVCTLVVLVLRMRPWKSRQLHHQLAWSVLAVIGLHSLLEFPLWYGPFQLAVLLCFGLLMRSPSSGLWVWPATVRALAVAALAILSVVAVDYARVRQIYMPAAQRWLWWREDPMGAAQASWFFGASAQFAELSLTPVTPDNAAHMLQLSQTLLHYSPEPKVIHPLIDSAHLLGQEDLAQWHQKQLNKVYPDP